MLASVRSLQGSLLGRAITAACVTIAFSYILFEVLDLDGSNFRTHRDPAQIAAIPKVKTDDNRFHVADSMHPGVGGSFMLLVKPTEWVHRFPTEESILPILYLLHQCGYRTALPRSSIPDDFLLSA